MDSVARVTDNAMMSFIPFATHQPLPTPTCMNDVAIALTILSILINLQLSTF